tara:strand:+ start:118 stop:456 length:339 start_codon:yes stop_codon:yes gene_type:complete
MSDPIVITDLMRLLAAVEFVDDALGDRPVPQWAMDCDCPLNPHHRWNCTLTPIWAQTMRELDCNPWTVVESVMPTCRSFGCGSPLGHAGDHDHGSLREQIDRQNAKNRRAAR